MSMDMTHARAVRAEMPSGIVPIRELLSRYRSLQGGSAHPCTEAHHQLTTHSSTNEGTDVHTPDSL